MEELSRALADCQIPISSDTLERLIEREGMLDKQVGCAGGLGGLGPGWPPCMLPGWALAPAAPATRLGA